MWWSQTLNETPNPGSEMDNAECQTWDKWEMKLSKLLNRNITCCCSVNFLFCQIWEQPASQMYNYPSLFHKYLVSSSFDTAWCHECGKYEWRISHPFCCAILCLSRLESLQRDHVLVTEGSKTCRWFWCISWIRFVWLLIIFRWYWYIHCSCRSTLIHPWILASSRYTTR